MNQLIFYTTKFFLVSSQHQDTFQKPIIYYGKCNILLDNLYLCCGKVSELA